MLRRRLLVLMLLLLSSVAWHIEASTRANDWNSISVDAAPTVIAPAAAAYDKQQQQPLEAWQPSAARSNWIWLQAATMAAGASNHRYDTAATRSATRARDSNYGARNDFLLQRRPVSSYAYNRSTGNYLLPPPAPAPDGSDARAVQPYVLAISTARRRPVQLGSVAHVDTLPRDSHFVGHNNENTNNNNSNRVDNDDSNNEIDTDSVRQDIDSRQRSSLSGFGNGIGDGGVDSFAAEAELNAILMPLESAVDGVRQFCDVVRRIISDDDKGIDNADDANDDDDHRASATSANAAAVPLTAESDLRPSRSAEVQGRHDAGATLRSLASQSSPPAGARGWPALNAAPAATSAIGTGRGKKLKKELRRLLLPLLIAYKLKFLTLIPVLIGGLTLLVGATGLAGFFFALFTAVMSLKSGGGSSKSIVVKKI